MKRYLKFLSLTSILLLISSLMHITISMEKERDSAGQPPSNFHPLMLSREQIKIIYLPDEDQQKELRHKYLPTLNEEDWGKIGKDKVILENVKIAEEEYTVLCSPKNEIETIKARLEKGVGMVAVFHSYMGNGNTVPSTSSSIVHYKLLYTLNQVPVLGDKLIYFTFYEVSSIPSLLREKKTHQSREEALENEKEKEPIKTAKPSSNKSSGSEDEAEPKKNKKSHKASRNESKRLKESRPSNKPLKEITSEQLERIFNTDQAVVLDEKTKQEYRVVVEDPMKKKEILELLINGGYLAVLSRTIGNKEVSSTADTKGKVKETYEYTLYKKNLLFGKSKAKASKESQVKEPENFPTFQMSYYYE